jgi:hypothetical protein
LMAADSTLPASAEFDIRELNVEQDRLNSRKIALFAIVALFAVGLALLFVLSDLGGLRSGLISSTRIAALVSVLIVSGLIFEASVAGLLSTRGGVRALNISREGITLQRDRDKAVVLRWTDPKLRFDIYDLTALPSDVLRFPCPYALRARGFDIALTAEAGQCLLQEVRTHGLAEIVERGSRWTYSARASPIIHHIAKR